MSTITLGLSAILGKTGEPANGDFNETDYTRYGLTYQDTAKMTQEDGEETEFYSEENDDPEEIITKTGKTTFAFSIMNPDLACLKRLFGGEIATNIWAYPDQVPRAKIKAKFNGEFSKKGLLLLEVTATVQKPHTDRLKKLYVTVIKKTT